MELSARAQKAAQPSNSSLISQVLQDQWHPETNPSGFISLGLAENSLMHKPLREHVQHNFSLPTSACTYGDGFTGSRRLKSAISGLLNRHLRPVIPIIPDHVLVTNGCSSALEQLAWAIANPGDGLLLGQPYYTRLDMDPSLRAGATVIPVPFQGVDPLGAAGVDAYETAMQEAAARGQKIAGVLLCNPHNPLGRCYSKEALLGLLRLCQKHRIHLISDEIYALSVWSNPQASDTDATAPFESVLSLATPAIIDPSLVHVVWGMSKDFGANGFRLGAIISQQNAHLHQSLLQGAIYSSVSSLSDHVAVQILENDAFTDDYISENKRKLATYYSIASKWADEHAIPYAKGVNAGFFLWVDLGSAYRARHPERAARGNVDADLRRVLLDNKVFIAAGSVFGAEEPGWYRIVFSVAEDVLLEGLERIVASLDV